MASEHDVSNEPNDLCLKSYLNKHVERYVHESEMKKVGYGQLMWRSLLSTICCGLTSSYAKVGDGLERVRYPATFDNARLSQRGLSIQNLNCYFYVVLTVRSRRML